MQVGFNESCGAMENRGNMYRPRHLDVLLHVFRYLSDGPHTIFGCGPWDFGYGIRFESGLVRGRRRGTLHCVVLHMRHK